MSSSSLSESLSYSPKMLVNIALLTSSSRCCIISSSSLSIMWLLDGTRDTEYLLIFVWCSCDNCFFVVLKIQIPQQPVKLTVLPPLNYKQDRLSISCISKSNFFVVILVLQKYPIWQNCYAVFMLCNLDEIISQEC